MSVRDRVRALRTKLELTQEAMAAKGGVGRVDVNRVEGGHNDASTYRLRAALAKAADLGVEDLAAYLDGGIGLDEVLRRRRSADPSSAREQAAQLAREDGVYEAAIQAVLEEPIAPENAHRSRLWWADRMRFRAQEMLRGKAPTAPTPPSTAGTITKRRGARRGGS